jgi:hypothetical protein
MKRFLVLCIVTVGIFWGNPKTVCGQIYVTSVHGTVGEYNLDGTTVNSSLITGLSNPEGIAAYGGHLFVANTANADWAGTIGEYNLDGTVVNASLVTGLRGPIGIAVTDEGIFEANYFYQTIGKYNFDGTTVNDTLIWAAGGGLRNLTISGTDLFVTHEFNSAVGKYTTSGATVNVSLISFPYGPEAVAVDGNDLYVSYWSSVNNGVIGEYDATTGAAINATLITGLYDPTDIVVYGGHLYVTDNVRGTVAEYNLDGTMVNATLLSGLDAPCGIVVVPEPSTLVMMLAAGLVGLATYMWRKRN